MRRYASVNKDTRVEERLKTIREFYELAYAVQGADKDLISFKADLKFVNDEIGLVQCCRSIAKQVNSLELVAKSDSSKKNYNSVALKLREVFNQIRDLISDEFRTIRRRNDRLPQIENCL